MEKLPQKHKEMIYMCIIAIICFLCLISLALIVLAVIYWYISLPIIGSTLVLYTYVKKKPNSKPKEYQYKQKPRKDIPSIEVLGKIKISCKYCGTELDYYDSCCEMCGNWQGFKNPTVCDHCGQVLRPGDSGFCKSCGNWYEMKVKE